MHMYINLCTSCYVRCCECEFVVSVVKCFNTFVCRRL